MKDTVFVPAFGNRPKDLVGREEILQRFEDALDSIPGSRDRAIMMLGQRGTGKTVLLLEFAEIAKKRGVIVASPTVVTKGMPERIIEKLEKSGAGIQFQEESKSDRSFAWRLDEICGELNKKGRSVLILIDEVRSSSDELRQLIASYQEMVGEGRDISIVLAGTPIAVSSVLNDHVLTFLNRAMKVELPPLKRNDIKIYFLKTLNEIGLTIGDAEADLTAQESEGSPYMMQLIGHYITLLSDEGNKVDLKTVERAASYAREDYINDICKTALEPLSEKDISFLVAVAASETGEMSDIVARLGSTSAYAQTYKRRLVQSGIIEQPRRGVVKLAVPHLREYLDAIIT